MAWVRQKVTAGEAKLPWQTIFIFFQFSCCHARPLCYLASIPEGRTARHARAETTKQTKQMSTPNNKNEAATIAPIAKEQVEAWQKEIAEQLGCDKEKKISGMDYLVIFLMALERAGVADRGQRKAGLSVAAGMKANASALRQWLYETKQAAAVSDKAAKYLDA